MGSVSPPAAGSVSLPDLLSMPSALMSGVAAGYGIAIPVGAIALLIVGTSIRCGFACGFSAGAGAATADLVYSLVAAGAGAAVATHLAPWAGPIRMASAGVLALIAGRGLWGIRRSRADEARSHDSARSELVATYARFLALTLINPLTVIYFTALALGSGWAIGGVAHLAAFALGAFAASLSWQTLLAAVGAFGGRGLSPRARVAALVAGNLIILGLALDLAMNR